MIIVYRRYTHTNSGKERVLLYSEPKFDSSGIIVGFNNKYGSQSYSHKFFDHGVTYWVKAKDGAFPLGAFTTNLTSNTVEASGTSKGVLVVAVSKNSPAFRASLTKGDIVRRIGELETNDQDSYQKAFTKYAGMETRVVLWRNGKEIIKEIKLNEGLKPNGKLNSQSPLLETKL